MVRFKANLSPKSFENLTKQLDIYAKNLESIKLDIHQALADYVYERIMFYMPVPRTGRLMDSFVEDVSQNMARVYTDLYYAKFVEFGTGIRGINSNYDSKYMQAESYSANYAGQPAQKFVYRAVLDLEQNYIEIARNVLKKKGLI